MKGTRLINIDLLKCIAIMMVVSLHVPVWECDFITASNKARVVQFAFRLMSEGVPLFAAINGFLLFRKKTFNFDQHKNRTKHLFILIIMWSAILNIINYLIVGESEPLSIELVSYKLLQPSFGLWFLQSLLGVYLIFPILWELFSNNFKLYKYIFCVESLVLICTYCLSLIEDFFPASAHVSILEDSLVFVGYLQFLGKNVWFLYYFCLGGIIFYYWNWIVKHRNSIAFLGAVSWVVASYVAYYLSSRDGDIRSNFNYASVFEIAIIIGLFALSSYFKGGNRLFTSAILLIGQNTFGIYITHMIIIRIINKYISADVLAEKLVIFFSAITIGTVFSIIMNKNNVLKKMISL